jgi:uncharacterized protein YdhG (YjbR/CyaY superfamily)
MNYLKSYRFYNRWPCSIAKPHLFQNDHSHKPFLTIPEIVTLVKTHLMQQTPASVDAYLQSFPEEIQTILQQIRDTIKAAAPEAVESIAYAMPAYKTEGKALVYFAGFKKHIGFYATPTGHAEFAEELSKYKQGKGSVQFPLNQPIPLELIKRIVVFRVRENADNTNKQKERP